MACGNESPPSGVPVDGGGGSPDRPAAVIDVATPAEDVPSAAGPEGGSPSPADAGATVATTDPTAGIAVAAITWGTCPDDMDPELLNLDDCARVKVPLDYGQPSGEQLELVVARLRALDPARRIGSLLIVPGGPGLGAVTEGDLAYWAADFSPEIRARFDLVSWDPRGNPTSPAIDCKATPSLPEIDLTYDLSPQTTQKEALVAAYRGWVESCKTNNPKLLPFIGTDATVSDLEILRRAVGDAKLTLIGFSYGTTVGLHYLLRYPERVRTMVLESVEDVWAPSVTSIDSDLEYEAALEAFFEWCGRAAAVDCPFDLDNPNKAAAYDALVETIRVTPVAAPRFPGKSVNVAMMRWGVGWYLDQEFSWPYLGAALERARMGVGNRLYEASVLAVGEPGPVEDPSISITCGDGDPVTVSQLDEMAAKLAKTRIAVPYAVTACVGWPVANLLRKPAAVPPQIPPVVLLAGTGHKWATSVAARLPGSTVLTTVAYNHGLYLNDDACIDGPVDAYLLEGKIPAEGIRCERPDPTAPPEGLFSATRNDGLEALAPERPFRRRALRRH